MTTPDPLATSQRNLVAFSTWIDAANEHRDPEAQIWGRVSKIAEENGEVIGALIGALGANPRKGVTHTIDDIVAELLDVAVTALGAVEHLRENTGTALTELLTKIDAVADRAGVAPKPRAAAKHALVDGQLRCLGDPSSDCWNWPDCECEEWTTGDDGHHEHPPVPQGRCWMLDWVNATYLDDTYAGEERFDGFPDGPVTPFWNGDNVQWKYDLVVDSVRDLPWFGAVLTSSEEYLASIPPVMWPSWYREYRERHA